VAAGCSSTTISAAARDIESKIKYYYYYIFRHVSFPSDPGHQVVGSSWGREKDQSTTTISTYGYGPQQQLAHQYSILRRTCMHGVSLLDFDLPVLDVVISSLLPTYHYLPVLICY
jgi:hypothetical protein